MVLVLLAAAWVSGFALVGCFEQPWWAGAAPWAGVGLGVASFHGKSRQWIAAGLTVAPLAVLGGLRADGFVSRSPPALAAYVGTDVVLTGRVDGDARRGLTTVRFPVSVAAVSSSDEPVPTRGRVLVSAGQYDALAVGTRVLLSGKLEPAPEVEGFDYAGFLARRGIVGTMLRPTIEPLAPPGRWDIVARLAVARHALDRAIGRVLPEPEASLASGILLGKDDAMAEDVRTAFRRTGLAHLVAVSGSNIVVVTAIVFAAASPLLGRRQAMVAAGLAILVYVGLAGAGWTIIRAAIMAGVYLAGEQLGRPRSTLDALAFTVIVMTAARPSAAFDVGFQLSAAATAGLVAFGPWIRLGVLSCLGGAGRSMVPGAVVDVLALSLSASIATLPISWATFGQVSLVGPIANIFVEPVFAAAFAAAGVTSIVAFAWPAAGEVAGFVAYYPLHEMVETAERLASVRGAAVTPGTVEARWAAIATALLAAAAWPAYRHLPPEAPPPRADRAAAVLRVAALALVATAGTLAFVNLSLMPARGPGALQLIALNVGQGDALLVVTPGGHQVLVDGGPSGLRLVQELGRVLPHWDRSLDAVVLTHPQEDHVGGLPAVFARYRVGVILDSGAVHTTRTYRLYAEASRHRSLAVASDASFVIDDIRFEVLWPPTGSPSDNLNDRSVVLRVSSREGSILLTGDLEGPALEHLSRNADVSADILKVPHHGSKTTPAWFFEAVDPEVAVISVGAGNSYGHPAPATLKSLEAVHTLRTDRDGRITVGLDGDTIKVRSTSGTSITLPKSRPGAYRWSPQEVAHGHAIRWQKPGPTPPGEADAPRPRIRRGELPGRVRKDPRSLRRQYRRAAARLVAGDGKRLGHLGVQHAPAGNEDPHAARGRARTTGRPDPGDPATDRPGPERGR